MNRVLVAWLLLASVALGQDTITFTNKTVTFTNLQGEVFRDVLLTRAIKQGIVYRIPDTAGGGLVSYTNLSPEFLESLGVPTNRIAALLARRAPSRPLAPRAPVAPLTASGERNDSIKSHLPDIESINEWDFPGTNAIPVCKEILSELNGIKRVLEIGITYNRFCDLLQEKALAVEKIKDLRGDSLPGRFTAHADWCIKQYAESRDAWHESIDTEYASMKALDEYFMHKHWAQAETELLYCTALAEGSTNIAPVVEHIASMIEAEQEAVKEGVLPTSDRDPAVFGMSAEAIAARLRAALAAQQRQAEAVLQKEAPSGTNTAVTH